ncbi:hypothetical protein HDU97_004803 [Phlyctochytrium planicorne]|nr:hypothetical protein HDU97_004803 [Phlyctochytrium planicorne]
MRFFAVLALCASLVVCVLGDRQPWEAPKKTYYRGPCPMLNALSNHGILWREGESIAMGDVLSAMETDLQMPSILSFLQAFYMTQFIDKIDYNFNLTSFHSFDHPVSLTRQDAGSTRPDPKLVNQLISFAGPKGYLDYDDIIHARRLRYSQSLAANPNLSFGLFQRGWAIYEAILLMEVLGHKGQLKADIAKDFLLNERLPLKWNPKPWDTGFYGWKLYKTFVTLVWKTYTLPDLPSEKKAGHDEL